MHPVSFASAGYAWIASIGRNRLFAGIRRRLTPLATFDVSYRWRTTDGPTSARPYAHVGCHPETDEVGAVVVEVANDG